MQQRIVTTRAMMMQTSSGRQVRTVDMREAAEIIGCSIEDISYWLAQGWIEMVECGCCAAVFAVLDEIIDIANLMVLDTLSDFDTLVSQRFEEMRAVTISAYETQVQEVRPRAQQLLPERVEQPTLRTHRLRSGDAQPTVRLNASPIIEQDPPGNRGGRLMESRMCRLEGSIPLHGVQKKRHWWQRES